MRKKLQNLTSFEISPVKKVDGGTSPYECFEQCEPTDPDLHSWAVYGRTKRKSLECLTDCPSKETAKYVTNALEIAYLKHPKLMTAANKGYSQMGKRRPGRSCPGAGYGDSVE